MHKKENENLDLFQQKETKMANYNFKIALTLLADDEITTWEPITASGYDFYDAMENAVNTYCESLKDVSETQPPWINITTSGTYNIHIFRAKNRAN